MTQPTWLIDQARNPRGQGHHPIIKRENLEQQMLSKLARRRVWKRTP